MTPHSSVFSKLDPAPHPLNIHIANGSTMHGNGLAFVSTTNLSVPRVFHVPDLSYNLYSMGKLAKLGYRLIFYYSRYIVQDPRIGQELRIGPRVRRMFPVDNLHLPLVAPVFFFWLLQLLQFRPYHLSHFGILVLVMHHLLGYNS